MEWRPLGKFCTDKWGGYDRLYTEIYHNPTVQTLWLLYASGATKERRSFSGYLGSTLRRSWLVGHLVTICGGITMIEEHRQRKRAMFWLDEDQIDRVGRWVTEQYFKNQVTGCSGGRFTYQFTPTTLGLVVKVLDNVTREELDLTDYNW